MDFLLKRPSGIEALPDELREGRRVQRIANVLNRKHRAAQYVAAVACRRGVSPCIRLPQLIPLPQVHRPCFQSPVSARVQLLRLVVLI